MREELKHRTLKNFSRRSNPKIDQTARRKFRREKTFPLLPVYSLTGSASSQKQRQKRVWWVICVFQSMTISASEANPTRSASDGPCQGLTRQGKSAAGKVLLRRKNRMGMKRTAGRGSDATRIRPTAERGTPGRPGARTRSSATKEANEY